MIYIDFQGGAHGNYLEFVCNKFLGNVPTQGDPFNDLGASHNKQYIDKKKFEAWHYFEFCGKKTIIKNSKIISIQITPDDLLLLSSISLLRAGDYNINNDQLEIDTYNKWNNIDYRRVLNNLIDSFFQSQVQESYNAVKDSSWPDINSLEDFKNLPKWIQDECINVHNLQLLELTPESPDCPRYILREFFKLSFKRPEQAGFMIEQEKMTYDSSNNVYIFPYECFYDTEKFTAQLTKVSDWLDYKFSKMEELINLHTKFLEKQPYKNSKNFCDDLLKKVLSKEHFEFPRLDLMQESYLTAKLELYYNTILPNKTNWFRNSQEILNCIT
jgi:hypothetical protein